MKDFWNRRGSNLTDKKTEVQRAETDNGLVVAIDFKSEASF